MRQAELGAAIGGYSQSMMSHIEAGRTPLRFERAADAARELSVSLDYLAGLADTPAPAAKLARRARTVEQLGRQLAQRVLAWRHPPTGGKPESVADGHHRSEKLKRIEEIASALAVLHREVDQPDIELNDAEQLGKQLAQLFLAWRYPRTFGKPGLAEDPHRMQELERRIEKVASELAALHEEADRLADRIEAEILDAEVLSQEPPDDLFPWEPDETALEERPAVAEVAAPADCDPVERLAVEPAAGAGSHIDLEQGIGWIWFHRRWLREHGLVASRCKVLGVLGDSMEPTLLDRSSILVDTSQRQRRPGGIFVVRAGDDLVVKRADRDARGRWTLVSDNPDKRTWPTLDWPNSAKIVGEVRWVARTL